MSRSAGGGCARRPGVTLTGSSIWGRLRLPPHPPHLVDAGFADFADRWNPILDAFDAAEVKFALEVHPTEIAFDASSAARAIEAVDGRGAFGFNYDPSHLAYQGVDYVGFILEFGDRIHHAHMKDVWWSDTPRRSGVFGGHLDFGHADRGWDFRSIGRGRVDFEEVLRALDRIGYAFPSIEWETAAWTRTRAREACERLRR